MRKVAAAPKASPVERLRVACLALPDTWEKVSHGAPTFWVGKTMFAMFADSTNHHGGGRYAVWCKSTHETQDMLLQLDPARFFRPPYVGVNGWVGVYLDQRPNWAQVGERLAEAHALARLKKARAKQGGRRVTSTR